MILKVWCKDDCRRFVLDRTALSLQNIRDKIQEAYQFEEPAAKRFLVKYVDPEGDLVTVVTEQDMETIVNNDVKNDDLAVLKIHVHLPAHGRKVSEAHAEEMFECIAKSAECDSRSIAEGAGDAMTSREQVMFEMLRDISLYISTREKSPVRQWVSMEKNFIAPGASPSAQIQDTDRYARLRVGGQSHRTEDVDLCASHDLQTWSVEDVCKWLISTGFEDIIAIFKDHDITGEVLLALGNDTLKEMGVNSTGKRIKLLKCIAELKGLNVAGHLTSSRPSSGQGSSPVYGSLKSEVESAAAKDTASKLRALFGGVEA
ncbi:hypothetical protein DFS34DRAFT_644818 [Phlyctochytrium arcticum]|nr:hypothetical protein DFS34DRAFT_644818 [Phlyctochytrium arcticum]